MVPVPWSRSNGQLLNVRLVFILPILQAVLVVLSTPTTTSSSYQVLAFEHGDAADCNASRFKCASTGECILKQLVCNGQDDCQDGSDEVPTLCRVGPKGEKCNGTDFQCLVTRRCIPAAWKCDGENDCGDGTDEPRSCVSKGCGLLEFECDNGRCVPMEVTCDSHDDCRDGSDERDCPGSSADPNKPSKEDSCRTLGNWFDEWVDPAECKNITCTPHSFHCANSSMCIPALWKCDGRKDCPDGSDEVKCKHRLACSAPSRPCDNYTKCVEVNQLCDNKRDCNDGYDEGGKCKEKTCSLKCQHKCQRTPEGPICVCPEGMHLENGTKCVHQHPCDIWGTCSQICIRGDKSDSKYHCSCQAEYELKTDGKTCTSTRTEAPYLVFSSRHELRGLDIRHLNSTENQFNLLISNLRNSIALDFFHGDSGDVIFWTDVVDDRIYKGNLVGGALINIEVVIKTGLQTAEGLAVDWIGENLYWVESNFDQIEVAKLNGSFRKTLISGNMLSPRSIAVDPKHGMLFWTDWDSDDPRIERASMSGNHRTTIKHVSIDGEAAWPNGLTLDYTTKYVYWVDAKLDSMFCITYDGGDYRKILKLGESHSFAVTIFNNDLFWTDWRSNEVYKANKFTGAGKLLVHQSYTQPFDIKVIHPSRQPRLNVNNPCAIENGGCSHLCLLSFNNTKDCGCPHLMMLGPDEKSCIVSDKMLIFAHQNKIRAVYFDKPYYHAAPPVSGPLLTAPASIDYMASKKYLYWCDAQSGETRRANISNPVSQIILDAAAGKPSAIAIDWISELLFVALQNSQRTSIGVTNLDGEYFSNVIPGKGDLKPISSMAVNPTQGHLYWAEGSAKTSFSIQMALMDGSNRHSISSSRENKNLENPSSLTFDTETNRLYWANLQTDAVQYYDFADKKVTTIKFDNLKPTLLTVYKDWILFVADGKESIFKGNKSTGGNYEVVRNNTDTVFSLRVYDPEDQTGTNPCSNKNGGCEHLCLPISASKKVCKCALGFEPEPRNESRCKSVNSVLVYSDNLGIKGINVAGNLMDDYLIPVALVNVAHDIDVDEAQEYLYWLESEKTTGKISRIKRDGTGRKVIFKDMDYIAGLVVDWNAGNMYWTNLKEAFIEVAKVDGSSHYVLITENLDKPMSLAVDPSKGLLFWNEFTDGRIESSGLDGSNRKMIVQKNPKQIHDITIDPETLELYWCDAMARKIFKSTYDGQNEVSVLSGSKDSYITSIVIDKGTMYWIDTVQNNNGNIMTAPTNDFSQARSLRKNLGSTLKDLTIFSNKRQIGRNACGVNNGGCADLCLFNGTHPICVCAHGRLGADGKTCESDEAFIVYSRVSSIETAYVSDDVSPNKPLKTIQNPDFIRNAIGLAFDSERKNIFYSDVQLGTIYRVSFENTNYTKIADKQGSVEGMYYEASTQLLYWTCSNDASINRIQPYSTNTSISPEKVLKLTVNDKPRGIAVDPCETRIYWTNWDTNSPSIQRSLIDGRQVESIITKDIRMPNGLTLDHVAKKLYWVDARLDKIERCDFDGRNRVIVGKDRPKHAFGIAVYGDFLYWTDWVLSAVMRANKHHFGDVMVVRKDIPKPMGIVAVSNQTERCIVNPCDINNGDCAGLCTLNESGNVVCSCELGRVLVEGRCVPSELNRTTCGHGEFMCSSGGCISYLLTCDGRSHCVDGSDEEEGYCRTRRCESGYFRCRSHGKCILKEDVCNNRDDCGDSSDELNCNCDENHFRCDYPVRCIPKKLMCNSQADCEDGSDESLANCLHSLTDSNCGDGFVPCGNSTTCILSSWVCDGHNDCSDGSDETNCSKHGGSMGAECQPHHFRCDDGQCILNSWRCDTEADCENGEDEKDCKDTCESGKFRCGSGECISNLLHCNGYPDCDDESDEIECPSGCDVATHFKCASSEKCIPSAWVCNTVADCDDKSDESPPGGCQSYCIDHGCFGFCSDREFQCLNGKCIRQDYYCDMDNDCGEGDTSDEPPSCPYRVCNSTDYFTCVSGGCVNKSLTCDGKDDCGDNSDESLPECKAKECTGSGKFLCKNGVCIDEIQVCNRENDCGDSSDEISCGINECENPNVCGRNSKCVDKKVGYECKCDAGYQMDVTENMCIDIDECKQRACSQLCVNEAGSYRCGCSKGYTLRPDNHTCKAESEVPVKIMLSNQYYIRMVGLNHDINLLAQNLSNAVALDFDWAGKCIYWSDVTAFGSSIKCLCQNTSAANQEDFTVEKTLHHLTVQSPDGLAVDWIGKNLYWCDKGSDTIEVSKLDGKYRKVLLHEGLQEPRAIALDPFHGYMYWTDWGDLPHIGRAGMDGKNASILITDYLGWPNALTISYESNEMFWADAREDYIAVADLNGQNMKIIHSRGRSPGARIHHIFAISVFEDYIYWSDWETKSVERCHKYSGENQTTVYGNIIHRPMDLKVYHPLRQPTVDDNPCKYNGGCQNLCLLKAKGGRVCACPEHYVLGDDGKSCINNCTSSQFECKTTFKCIPKWWKCDRQDDCGDGSDEDPSCPAFNCTAGQYQCPSGECLHPGQLCDGKTNCKNGTDELDCDKHTCLSNQFKCEGNGKVQSICIPSYLQCDGQVDCPITELAQDEQNCLPKACPKNQFSCKNGKCIQAEWVCDTEDDCGDLSDEGELCSNRTCDETKFKCNTGKCIPKQWTCDGENDCKGGEDEAADKCASEELHSCEPTYFKCKNNKCIPGRWHCDYEDDCHDGSDEIGCPLRNCSESEFRCDDGRCIRNSLVCDGDFNCPDGSDEQKCNVTCMPHEFQCVNPPHCVYNGWVCDGDEDCKDGSDELNCPNKECGPDQFKCTKGECIKSLWACDGEKDCSDGSDEEAKMCEAKVCEPGRFRCRNNVCIPYSKACDGTPDCSDGSDELPKMCPRHFCKDHEFRCANDHCVDKHLLCDGYNDCGDDSDEIQCAPCAFGSCSHACIVKNHMFTGSKSKVHNFSCECGNGYMLAHHGNISTCELADKQVYMLVVSLGHASELKKVDPHKPHPHNNQSTAELPALDGKVESLDYLMNEDGSVVLFYISANASHKSIQRYKVESNGRSKRSPGIVDVITGLIDPRGIAVDWIGKLLFWIDAAQKSISASTLDGKQKVVVIKKNIVDPHDIVVDPESGRMYWSDWGFQRVDVAKMDGTDRKPLANSPCPSGLAIDYPAQRIYWTDVKSHSVETTTLDGRDRQSLKAFPHGDIKPYRIDILEDELFITAYQSNQMMKMNKFGRSEVQPISTGTQNVADVVIVHKFKQKQLESPCKGKTCIGGLCMLNGNNASTCVCPHHGTPTKLFDQPHIFECYNNKEECSLPCKQGKCELGPNGPYCKCNSLYEGPRCEKYRCSGFCLNKGVCYHDAEYGQEDPMPIQCNCPPEWTGERCDVPVRCDDKCHNGGTCNDTTNICACPPGFGGSLCQNCDNLTCENGGFCVIDKRGKSHCQCPQEYAGSRCEKSLCGGYCQNKGKCRVKDGQPECTCISPFIGKRCKDDLCGGRCKNGGTCVTTATGHQCSCPRPYVGEDCETNVCQCGGCKDSESCKNCPSGPLPDYCDADGKESGACAGFVCKNNGTCVSVAGRKACRCHDRYIGLKCEAKLEPHVKNPCANECLHNGVCILENLNKKPSCLCTLEWAGENCGVKNDCINYCFNSAECTKNPDPSLEPICHCTSGFSGPRCQYRASESAAQEDGTPTWKYALLVILGIFVAAAVAGFAGCAAYVIMRRKQGRPFMHVRMHDNGTVEINNPMFLKEEGEEDHGGSEPSLIFDSDKVLLQGTNFANPVYETVYKQGESSHVSDEKKGLLQGEEFSSSVDHPLADPLS